MKAGQTSDNSFGANAKIYTLADEKGNVFYVGCTVKSLEGRLQGHISEARSNSGMSNQRKNAKIRELDYKIVATIVDMLWVTGSKAKYAINQAKELEAQWVQKYIALGFNLVNVRLLEKPRKAEREEKIGMSISAQELMAEVEAVKQLRNQPAA